MIEEITFWRAKCAACGDHLGSDHTRDGLLRYLQDNGHCIDYEGIGQALCRECNEAGRTPNVDEGLRLTTANPVDNPEEADIARYVSEGGNWSDPL